MPSKREVPKVETEIMITKDAQPRYEAVLGAKEASSCCSGRSSSACWCRSRFLLGDQSLLMQRLESQVAASESLLPDPALENL